MMSQSLWQPYWRTFDWKLAFYALVGSDGINHSGLVIFLDAELVILNVSADRHSQL